MFGLSKQFSRSATGLPDFSPCVAIISRPVWALAAALALLTAVRIAVLFVSPLELYPDEAQYWLWSRRLAFGYFSKPPLIAWLIRATTAFGGHSEPWVRVSAPVMHGLAALFLALAGRRLYGAVTGVAAAVIYSLAPGVQLSCAVIATDAPLMACLSLALWAYAAWWSAMDAKAVRWAAAGFGLALGAAFLAKYAALYFLGGAILHGVFSRAARARWRPGDAALAVACFVAVAAPNIAWNAAHHFQTVAHTASNANLDEDSRRVGWLDPRGGLGYIVGQFGVFGPIAFGIFLGGAVALWRKKRLLPQDILLLAFAAPPLVIVLIEAVVSRANANWAGAAYGPMAILVAAMLLRWRAFGALIAIVASQGVIAAIFLSVFAFPGLADRAGFANSFKRARGWAASTVVVEQAAETAISLGRPLTALAVDDRFLFNALSYYGRDGRGQPAAALPAPLKMWVREAKPHSQAETMAPLVAADGGRVLIVNFTPIYKSEIIADFVRVEPGLQAAVIPLDAKHQRNLTLFVGDDFQRQPRDPRTGRPVHP
jgi:4-amino-4-deoxy-L-arabinose transferase-like glycosyltransferase